jgi:hypothetical protein
MNHPSSKLAHRLNESVPVEPFTLDCDHILTHAGGDPELLIQLCGNFLNELPIRVESLNHAIKARNNLGIERALTQLRTCLMVFGSGKLSFTVETLQAAVCGGRVRQIKGERKRLERQLQVLVPQVQRLMLEMATPTTAVQ